MTSLTHQGLNYRTKLMDQARAERFALCLSANERFCQVQVRESDRSRGKFFVAYQPASDARYAELLQQQQDARQARAAAEGAGYVFVLDKDGGRPFFWCLSTSGEVYEVTQHSCTCPDHQYRCSKVGLQCKHQLALLSGQGEVRSF